MPIDPVISLALTDPSHPLWTRRLPLPDWVSSFRPHQTEVVSDILDAFTRTDIVICEAPVGSGKTLVAEMVRRALDVRSLFVCTTKSLQDQVLRDFPHTRVLKGRSNYPTQFGEFPDVTSADCTSTYPDDPCMWCDSKSLCGYSVAKRDALTAHTAVLNTSYFLTEANGPGAFGNTARADNSRDLVVVDEADQLESALLGYVEVEVGSWWRKQLRIGMPQVKTESAKSNDWQEWAEEAVEAARYYHANLPVGSTDVRAIRHRARTFNLLSKLEMLVKELPEGGWVFDGYERKDPTVVFKPVRVDKFGPQYVFKHGRKFLLMSGTVISSSEMSDSLGIEDHEFVNVKLNWDPARRPVYVCPVANVTWKEKATAYPALASAINTILLKHPDDRVLVHAVSYDLANFLVSELSFGMDRPLVTYTQASERDDALSRYLSNERSVLIAPSMDRGLDLPDDACRVQVIAKVPWPALGDKQVSTRANMGRRGKLWYRTNTIRTVVQMLGRGMRHEEDMVTSYILDAQFTDNLWKRSKSLFPGYVKDALIFDGTVLR